MKNQSPLDSEVSLSERSQLLKSALEFISDSRQLIMRYWREGGLGTEIKDDESPVTLADKGAEEILRARIEKAYPTHGIIGEEFGYSNPTAEFQWVIDPIDGTTNFANGIPTFGTILGLRFRERSFLGVLDHPAINHCYSGAIGIGVTLNGKAIAIKDSGVTKLLPHHIIATASRSCFQRSGDEHVFDSFMKHHSTTRIYYDCFSHAMAVGGNVEAMIAYNEKLWDFCAAEALVEAAGGKFVSIKKYEKPDYPTQFSHVLGKPSMVDVLVKMLGEL